MAKYWMHSGFLTVEGAKMSKSLGNFITIQDFLNQHSPRILRLLVLKAHYRSPIDYSPNLLVQTKRELERIDEFIENLKACKGKSKTSFPIKKFKKDFISALEDDFNTPKAIAVLFDVLLRGNTLLAEDTLSKKNAEEILTFLKEVDTIFGFIFSKKKKEVVPSGVVKLVKEREEYRTNSQWKKSDKLREMLLKLGWEVDDTPKGPRLKKIS